MSELNLQELEKVAETYEKLLAPALFSEWAHRLADAAEIRQGQHILDVACGTGILARVIAERVGTDGSVSGVDANPGMLAVANRIAPEIEWREGDAEALPYEDASFDAVLCQFGLMLFSSPKTALQEMQRVLRPGGNLTTAVFGSLDDLPDYAAVAEVYERVVNKSVADALRMPFSMGDRDALASVFANAGISSIKMETEEGTACFSSVRNMVLSDVKGWFPFAGILLDEDTIEAITEEAEIALKAFQTSGGTVEFPVPVHIVTATKS
ncbi:methyltransferase domain-containing protein [Marinobacter changyiensis]|uniref:methyltransferase domain-containing protein n=1 Tax=Marinobacter changyiensis TaxID=2604091 RepID=UPI001265280C|nr:methyltransferase domain-containing protein [Marinobacter changyiensis]